MKIWAHSLVKNEERYLWFSVASVVGFVDRVLLWDTGSTDKTREICKELMKKFPGKIDYKEVTITNADEFPKLRQEMLEITDSDWLLMLDGDEVWWEDSIKRLVDAIGGKGNSVESIVVPMVYPVGDIFHYQEEAAGKYMLAGKKGHYALRAINRKIPGLSSSNPHGTWGWTDGEGRMIQDRDQNEIFFLDAPYMHFSLMPRAGKRSEDEKVIKRIQKLKHELGNSFPLDYYFPEVFFRFAPKVVPSPWERMERGFLLRAFLETPLRKAKRRLWQGKVGY